MNQTTLPIAGLWAIALTVLAASPYAARGLEPKLATMPWDEANISTLGAFDRDAIQKFVNSPEANGVPPGEGPLSVVSPVNVDQFAWADFAGKGQFVLVVVWDTGHGGQAPSVFRRSTFGRVDKQDVDLENLGSEGPLKDAIRDLNGDGKKELLFYCGFGVGRSMADTPLTQWPAVYRFHDGKLVEASHEFPSFYEKEFLPELAEKISRLQKKLASEAEALSSGEAKMKQYHLNPSEILSPQQIIAVTDEEQLAILESLRDHIIVAVLGRTLTAEQVNQARQWLNSSDYQILDDVEGTFEEMGSGHEIEALEAQQAKQRLAQP